MTDLSGFHLHFPDGQRELTWQEYASWLLEQNGKLMATVASLRVELETAKAAESKAVNAKIKADELARNAMKDADDKYQRSFTWLTQQTNKKIQRMRR